MEAHPARSVAARLLSVLDAVERASGPLQVTQVAERTGLPVATAWRMVRELTEWGGLERHADGRYRLATRVWAIGSSAPCVRRIQRDTSRYVRELAESAGCTAHLSVLDHDDALVVSLARVRGRADPDLREGARLGVGDSSAGRLFRAFGAAGDPGHDEEPAIATRRTHLAVHRSAPGRSSSISVAITDPSGAVTAALTLAGGPDEPWHRWRPALVAAARTVRFSIYREELLAPG